MIVRLQLDIDTPSSALLNSPDFKCGRGKKLRRPKEDCAHDQIILHAGSLAEVEPTGHTRPEAKVLIFAFQPIQFSASLMSILSSTHSLAPFNSRSFVSSIVSMPSRATPALSTMRRISLISWGQTRCKASSSRNLQ